MKRGKRNLKAILPDTCRFSVVRRGRKMVFHYEETFRGLVRGRGSVKSLRRVEAVADALRVAVDPRVKVTHSIRRSVVTFRMAGTVSREVVGDMLAGEFMAWSSIAQLQLKDIIVAGILYNVERKRRQGG